MPASQVKEPVKISAPPAGRRKQSPLWVLAQTTAALVAVVLLLELIFGLAGIGEAEYLQIDPVLGWSPMPGKSVTYRKEGFARVKINSWGMRDSERILDKPPGVFRIAVMGDSYVEAVQVDHTQTFCQKLEKRLNELYGPGKFEVLNFAVSAYNLGQMYVRQKELVMKFKPDLVIYGLRVDTIPALGPNPDGGFFFARPVFAAGADGELVQSNLLMTMWGRSGEARRMRATAWLREHSRIWGALSECIEKLMYWWRHRDEHENAVAAKMGSSDFRSDTYDAATDYLGKIAATLLREADRTCHDGGARLAVVYFPGPSGLHNKTESRILREACKSIHAPYLDLTQPFASAEADSRPDLFYSFHLAPGGHQLVTEELLRFLSTNRMFPANKGS